MRQVNNNLHKSYSEILNNRRSDKKIAFQSYFFSESERLLGNFGNNSYVDYCLPFCIITLQFKTHNLLLMLYIFIISGRVRGTLFNKYPSHFLKKKTYKKI